MSQASVGDMNGYLNLKGYGEFAAETRPAGWNTWLTFSLSPSAAHQHRDAYPTETAGRTPADTRLRQSAPSFARG